MSFRDWRPRRMVAICLGWILAVSTVAVARGVLAARQVQRRDGDDLYVVIRTPGGAWALLGPPLLLLAAWWWRRRSRPAA